MKILVVEDEPKTAAALHKGLHERGFDVDLAGDGGDGIFLATHHPYDLVILDIVLPRQDGWSVLSRIREVGVRTPVMFLTACDSMPERARGLKLGVGDYLVKPLAFSELLARVRARLRREPGLGAGTLRVAALEIDVTGQRVTRAGRLLSLTRKEIALLALLAQRSGEILPCALIAEQVWEMSFDGDTSVVEVAIRRLRSKVDDPFEDKLIHSVRGMGYVLEQR